MAETNAKTDVRPVPRDLKMLCAILSMHTLSAGFIQSFVQAIFASNLFIGSVVAVVGGCITPAGIYLVKKLTSCLSPKAALITIVGASVFGLFMALTIDHFFVMIWGFVTGSMSMQLMLQYVSDFHASVGATDAEKAAWFGQLNQAPSCALLVGCLLGPCLFTGIWQAQACSLVLLSLASSALFLLPSPASSKPPDAPWRLREFSTNLMPGFFMLTMLAIHNSCREAMLGPSLTMRMELDSWTWGQLQFLGCLGGMIGGLMSMSAVPQATFPATVVAVCLSLITRTVEHFTTSLSVFMAATFASAILKMLLAPLLWKLVGGSPLAEKMPILQQVQAVTDGVVGWMAPMTVLTVAGADFNLSRALYFLSGLLVVVGVILFPNSSAVQTGKKSD